MRPVGRTGCASGRDPLAACTPAEAADAPAWPYQPEEPRALLCGHSFVAAVSSTGNQPDLSALSPRTLSLFNNRIILDRKEDQGIPKGEETVGVVPLCAHTIPPTLQYIAKYPSYRQSRTFTRKDHDHFVDMFNCGDWNAFPLNPRVIFALF